MSGGIPTRRRVEYARGYLGLGLLEPAAAELDAVAVEDREDPAVLGAWIDLHLTARHWELVVGLARRLVERDAAAEQGWIAWAFALRELERVVEAKAVLLRAEPGHGATSALLHYNLGCYHCLLGERAEARERLRRAFAMEAGLRETAATDRDLDAMRNELPPAG